MPTEPDPPTPPQPPGAPEPANEDPARPGAEAARSRGRGEPREEPRPVDDPDRFERLETVKRLGLEFQERFFGVAIERQGQRIEWLAERAFALSELGRYSESLELDRSVVSSQPEDPTARYNLACSLCLVGELDAALDELERALALGYRDQAFLAEDPDLQALHGHPRFDALLAR
ncbi:MAG: TPR end-of-group domain-containing protein [Planctomycetota bacterium]|jgi:tetratricopeptide (TPR) repeat protein